MKVDAIVNAASPSLLGGGGVDGCIHRAAGKELLEECKTLGGGAVGEAKITAGFRLPSRYVIHTVGSIWRGGADNEQDLLAACYRNSLDLAKAHGCESIAFPLISAGAYGYPKAQAFKVAIDAISAFLLDHDIIVHLVVFDKDSVSISEKLFADIQEFIDDIYVDELANRHSRVRSLEVPVIKSFPTLKSETILREPPLPVARDDAHASEIADDLEARLKQVDESFSQMLLRLIDQRGLTDAACYKKANIDRKLFSKIRSDVHYKPSKSTVLSFAVALELSLPETIDMLRTAGFALSHSKKFDIIVEYFIAKQMFDIYEINEALFAFDQPLLGS